MSFSVEQFYQLGVEYQLDVFWFWNADVTPAGIEKRLLMMKEAGIGGVFIHPMPDDFRKADFVSGMKIGYLSEAFFDRIESAVKAAKKLDMRVWIYDEGGWPSGHALRKVPAVNPDYRGSALRLVRSDSVEASEGSFVFDKDTRYSFQRSFDNTFTYRAPSDLLNPDVTDAFIEITLEPYKQRVGDEFGGTVVGVFTDEPRFSGYIGTDEIPWTPNMPAEFKERKGYDVEPYLGALFKKTAKYYSQDEVDRSRIDYMDVCSALFSEHYFKRVHEWCQRNSLLYSGHVCGEEDLYNHSIYTGSIFRSLRHFDIPGIDAIWRQVFKGGKNNNFPLYGAGVCSVNGKKLLSSETFAVYGLGLTFEQMKWITASQYARGVNMVCPMPFHYSRDGGRCIGVATDFYHDPKLEYFRAYSDYLARLNSFCRQGDRSASAALYYPIRSLWAGKDDKLVKSFDDTVQSLVAEHIQFDIIDDDAVAEGLVSRYRHLLLPPGSRMSERAEVAVKRFVEGGGITLSCDQHEELEPCIALSGDTDGVVCIRRDSQDGDYYFLFNESGRERKFAIEVSPERACYLADFDSGAFSMADQADGVVSLALRPGEAIGVLECRLPANSVGQAHKSNLKTVKPKIRMWSGEIGRYIIDEKSIRFQKKRAIELADCTCPSVDKFSGKKLYKVELDVEPEWLQFESVTIDFGAVKHFIDLKVNGKSAGYRVWSPYSFEVKHLLRPGLNSLEAVVSNTLADLMYSEETEGFLSEMGWKNAYYDKAKAIDGQSFGIGIGGPIKLLLGVG